MGCVGGSFLVDECIRSQHRGSNYFCKRDVWPESLRCSTTLRYREHKLPHVLCSWPNKSSAHRRNSRVGFASDYNRQFPTGVAIAWVSPLEQSDHTYLD